MKLAATLSYKLLGRVGVQQPCSNPDEQQWMITKCFKREYAYLQEFLNTGKQSRQYESAFARRRSRVRIPSAPFSRTL